MEILPSKQFTEALKKQAAIGETDEVRKRLGHEGLGNKKASVKYAEKVATKKRGDAPEKRENASLEEYTRESVVAAGPY
jgi:hypothetical protein